MPYTIDVEGVGEVEVSDDLTPLQAAEQLHQKFFRQPTTVTASSALQAPSVGQPESPQSINRFFAQAAVDQQDSPNMAGARGAWESLITPQVNINRVQGSPDDLMIDKVSGGLYNAGAGLLEFFTSPIGIATAGLSALPVGVGKVAGGLFAADLSRALPEVAHGISEAVKAGDVQKATELGASGAVQLLAIGGGMKHAIGEGIPVRPPARQTTGPEGEPLIQPPPIERTVEQAPVVEPIARAVPDEVALLTLPAVDEVPGSQKAAARASILRGEGSGQGLSRKENEARLKALDESDAKKSEQRKVEEAARDERNNQDAQRENRDVSLAMLESNPEWAIRAKELAGDIPAQDQLKAQIESQKNEALRLSKEREEKFLNKDSPEYYRAGDAVEAEYSKLSQLERMQDMIEAVKDGSESLKVNQPEALPPAIVVTPDPSPTPKPVPVEPPKAEVKPEGWTDERLAIFQKQTAEARAVAAKREADRIPPLITPEEQAALIKQGPPSETVARMEAEETAYKAHKPKRTGAELQKEYKAQQRAKGSPVDETLTESQAVKELKLEGVSKSDAEALVYGEKTVKEVVEGNFKVRPSRNVGVEQGHDEAFAEGYNQAIQRLSDILDRTEKTLPEDAIPTLQSDTPQYRAEQKRLDQTGLDSMVKQGYSQDAINKYADTHGLKRPKEPPPAEPKGPGLGGQRPGARTATPSVKPEAPESYEGTALKHAVDEMERAGHNFGGRPQQEIQPMLEAWIRSAKDPAANAKLARELIANPRRGLTGDESAMILRHKVALSNALNDAAEKTFTGKPEDKAFNRSEFDRASDELKTFMDAVNERGSEWGREGRWRQAVAYEDYTFATQERLLRAAKGGERLNDAEHTQLVKEVAEHKRLLEEAKKHAEGETGRQTKITEDAVKEVVEKYEKAAGKQPKVHPDIMAAAERIVVNLEARGAKAFDRLKSKLARTNVAVDPTIIIDLAEMGVGKLARAAMDSAKWIESMLSELGEFGEQMKPFLPEAFEASKKLLADDLSKVKGPEKEQVTRKAKKGADITEQKEVAIENIKHKVETRKLDELNPFIQKLTRIVIAEGAKGWREVTDRVHAILKDIVPGLDYRDTMIAISGHGEVSGLKLDPISVEKSKVTGLIHKILQIQEVIGRRKVEGKGFQRGLTPDEQRRFNAIYNEAKRRFGIVNSESIVRSTLQARETFYKNRLADLKHEIETGKRIVRTKSPSPTSARLEKLQAEYEALKKEHDAIFPRPDLTDAQKLDLAEKAAARMEGEWNKKLADAKRGVFEDPSVQGWKAKSAKLEEIRARTDAAREQVKEMREATDQFKADKLEKDLARVEARSAVLEKEINEGFSEAKKAKKPIDEKLQAAIDERNQLNKMKGELQRAMKPKKSPEEIALQSYITRATNRLADLNAKNADLEAKLKSGELTPSDIAPKPKRQPLDISKDTEAMRLKAELSTVEKRIAKNRYEAQRKLRTLPRKILDGIKQTPGAFINIVSSVDFSALRQALPAILSLSTRPIRGWPELAKGVGRMFSSAFSEQRALMIEQQIQNRKNARSGADKIMGLDFTELNATKFTKYEDAAHSVLDEWAKLPYKTGKLGKTIATAPAKVLANVVRGSNRAFVTFLNSTRASLADELLRANYSKEAPTPAQLREVGYLTNLATGRGELDPMTARVAAKVVWSPNLLASRVKLATGMPLWRALKTKNPKAIKIVAEEYARVIISGYLLGQVAMLFDEKEGEPSTSSDYGKIVRGNTRVDIWGGFQQITVAGSRVAQGVTTSLKGKTQDITKGKFGVDTALDVGVRFGRSKLRPDWSILVNVLDRQDFIGRNTNIATEEGRARVAESLIPIPLSLHEITSVMKERGFTEGMIIQALSAFGAGVSNYEDKEVQR